MNSRLPVDSAFCPYFQVYNRGWWRSITIAWTPNNFLVVFNDREMNFISAVAACNIQYRPRLVEYYLVFSWFWRTMKTQIAFGANNNDWERQQVKLELAMHFFVHHMFVQLVTFKDPRLRVSLLMLHALNKPLVLQCHCINTHVILVSKFSLSFPYFYKGSITNKFCNLNTVTTVVERQFDI